MTDDLVAFLRERLDEDDQAARVAPGPSWEHRQVRGDYDEAVVFEDYVAVADPERNTVVLSDVDAEVLPFVLRHDPARVLAEVDAKRRLLDQTYPELQWADDAAESEWSVHQEAARDFLKILALPYRDHPGYRPEWAP